MPVGVTSYEAMQAISKISPNRQMEAGYEQRACRLGLANKMLLKPYPVSKPAAK